MKRRVFLLGLAVAAAGVRADWPTLRGGPDHAGFVTTDLKPPFRVAWARHFDGERLGTAMEPIVAGDRLFVATHSGNVYALDARTAEPLWRLQAHGAFLQSPTVDGATVLAACTDGHLYALDAATGRLRWHLFAGHGGFSAAPTVVDDRAFVGSRAGEFFAVAVPSGKILWRAALGVPVRQTAAVGDGRVFVTGEDLRVRCWQAADGKLLWTSDPLVGQTARDYYPIVVKAGGRTFVAVRTNPILNMGQRIGRDRTMLCRNAGVDDSGWQKVDAWTRSDAARGTPDLWAKEQQAIRAHLDANRDARTFFVLDAATGREAFTAPVLWIAGCQAVGAMPALTADGRLLVFHRSAYGNWNHGVAPLVALGLLDLARNQITPLFHQQGMRPQWNNFWGTADESQNFVVAGDTVLIVHQGNLSGFDLKSNRLFPIAGERDTFGGYRSPPWARNEWHGPGRGGVAVAGNRLYWQTGSRLLCLVAGESGKAPEPAGVDGAKVAGQPAPPPPARALQQLREGLAQTVAEILARPWAPLFVDPGLAGRDFSFDDSGELFEALAWACPHLPADLQAKAKALLAEAWTQHPPFAKEAWFPLKDGAAREWFRLPDEFRVRLGSDRPHHPFGNLHAVWRYAQRCGELPRVRAAWPQLKASYDDFHKSGWKLDGAKGDLFANRYLASLLAFAQLAELAGEPELAKQARAQADDTTTALVAWWQRAAEQGTLTNFKGSGELDPFIGKGDGLSFRVAPHRHKVALFRDLTPEVAAQVKGKAPEAVAKVWAVFETLYRTWPLTGEERQVHFGENFVDAPDLALGGFAALAWLRGASAGELARRVDLPFCRADLYHATKLALALEAGRGR
jgi:hypothetical protein